ncbi:MAG: flagellar hook-length control protein FliK [Defluviitaleaceae bacterium]|nr:flagellar hook-length control protein FliK [Defluviitaleaceae bacterium]
MNNLSTNLSAARDKEAAQKSLPKATASYIEKPVDATKPQPAPITPADVVDQLLLSDHGELATKNTKSNKLLSLLPIPTEGGVPMLIIDSIGSVFPGKGVEAATGVSPDNSGAQMMEQVKEPPQIKSLVDLVPGQSFSAEILDIQQGAITLKMGDGLPLTARSMVVPDARIGDRAAFLVRETKPGQIMLEFLRGGIGESKVPASIVKEALTAANMQHTAANAGIIEDLVVRNMPIDVSTLQRTAFFKYSMPHAPFEHIQFLIDNNFAPTDRTVEMFTGMVKGEMNIMGELAQVKQILDSPEFAMAKQSGAWEGLVNQLKSLQPPATETAQMTQPMEYLENLRNISKEIFELAKQEGQTELANKANNVADIVDFARNITETKMYFQFPFTGVEGERLAELHVFKKKAGKDKAGGGKNATALIGLDTGYLGRVEVLVNKTDRNVNIQFRSDTGETLKTVKLKGHELSDMLKEAGFIMTSLKTKKIDETFDISQSQATVEPVPFFRKNTPPPETGNKRYSFDVRV